ncbi:MAG TPA: plastocyanin/azurin family copper-binding protein [Acidimicrobiales bacterium]|nr:plastocyanin/azurin family copper-binding protein [Acidimicrobiales bacterium]
MRKLLIPILVLAASVGACGGDSDPSSATKKTDPKGPAVIKAEGTLWKPAEITVGAGEVVTWKVEKGLLHDLVGEDDVKHEAADEFTATHTYSKPGEYNYQCTLHGGMKGTVTVT